MVSGLSISSSANPRATGSGGALLLVAAAQVLVGLSILGIYEGDSGLQAPVPHAASGQQTCSSALPPGPALAPAAAS